MARDVGDKGDKSKTPMPWFKMFPEAYLEGTRRLTAEQRGIYSDCLMLLYKHDQPLPKNDAWMACELHVNVKVWRRVRGVLLSLEKLIETPDGYTNNRVAIECEHRRNRSSKTVANQLQLGLQLGSKTVATRLQTVSDHGLPNDNNERPPKLHVVSSATSDENGTRHAGVRARASDHQTLDNKEERTLSCADASLIDDDDPHRRRSQLSPALVTALHKKLGDEIAAHALKTYFTSDYAKHAQVIDKAFPAWVERVYHVRLSEELSNKEIAAEIMAMLPKDETGKPDRSLPKTVRGPQPLRKKVEAA